MPAKISGFVKSAENWNERDRGEGERLGEDAIRFLRLNADGGMEARRSPTTVPTVEQALLWPTGEEVMTIVRQGVRI